MREIIVTYCDRVGGMLDEYRTQVLSASIAFHVELVSPFPNPAGLPLSFKLHWMRTFATNFYYARRLIFTDAYDVLFTGTSEQLEQIPEAVMWGAERNCYPEPHLADLIPGDTPWRFVNAGLMSGSPEAILDWVADAQRHPLFDPNSLDQCWLNRRRADTPNLISLDSTTSLFYVVSSTLERDELKMQDGKPWNSLCYTFPCFFHFSGSCPTDNFRKMLLW